LRGARRVQVHDTGVPEVFQQPQSNNIIGMP
jgi:hypothetical protein